MLGGSDEHMSAGRLPPTLLKAGEVLSKRFVVGRVAGRGGMGTVHRGVDLSTQQPVALKVVSTRASDDLARFAKEAAILAELSHPAIVRYVAHGVLPNGRPYLAMEWLEGEDLATRLLRGELGVEDSLVLLRRACEALSLAHQRQIVHRDVKPSNLFLVDGDPACLKVLDFGIARYDAGPVKLTGSQDVIGTVGYMAPEQIMAAHDVDARADVFALGCVLFECLCGSAAFAGSNALAVLARILRGEPWMGNERWRDLDGTLQELLLRTLAKDPAQRPVDAAALLTALQAARTPTVPARASQRNTPSLTGFEQRTVSVILGRPAQRASVLPVDARAWLSPGELQRTRERLAGYGAEPVLLRTGELLVFFDGSGAATDQARRAADCALTLWRMRLDLCLVVATGRSATTNRVPAGVAIDAAAERLGELQDPGQGIAIDDLTADLLDPAYKLRGARGDRWLLARRSAADATRLLMGKPTPFVGRTKELGLLELTLSECLEEEVARAVVVIGPPGQGKSRLRQEFHRRLSGRRDVQLLFARAEAIGAGSAFSLARQLLLQALLLSESAGLDERRLRLGAHLAELMRSDEKAQLIWEFLCELLDAPVADPSCPQLRAARNDAQIMGSWLRQTFAHWIDAECRRQPLLIVLEDLHWSDAPSVSFIGDALQRGAARPLLVLALARPEIRQTFPDLWSGAEKNELHLGRLPPRAAERLARAVLGSAAADETVALVVDRADGNSFYLEELLRHVAEGHAVGMPESVIALVESRLRQLTPEARRVARAASLFGETFWQGGLAALLGETPRDALLSALQCMVQREICVETEERRFADQVTYRFRHAILREAAYSMLTETDRVQGHALAGAWLETVGERDALTLADHFERGGDGPRALRWLRAAAAAAVEGGNHPQVLDLCRRGLACGAQGHERGLLLTLRAQALWITSRWTEAIDTAREAIGLLPPGTSAWFEPIACLLLSAAFLGDPARAAAELLEISRLDVKSEYTGPYGYATTCATQALAQMSQLDAARSVLERAVPQGESPSASDPMFAFWIHMSRAFLALADGEPGRAFSDLELAASHAAISGTPIARAVLELYRLGALSQTGHIERAARAQRALLAQCEPLGLQLVSDWGGCFLGWAHVIAGQPADAIAALEPLLARRGFDFLAQTARAALVDALLYSGQPERAESEATRLLAVAGTPWPRATALRGLALVQLTTGQTARALESAELGLVEAAKGGFAITTSSLLLTRAEALHALSRESEARTAIAAARQRVLRLSATMPDAELAEAVCTRVDVHARTLQLAEAW